MKIKKMNHLHWLLMLFVTVCESLDSSYKNHHYSSGKSISSDYRERANQLRRVRSSPNQKSNSIMSPLNMSASSLQKVSFLPEDSIEPSKRHSFTHQHHYQKGSKQSEPKRDLSEPLGFLNAVANDHATSSTNQDSDTVRYPPNKTYKSTSGEPQSFSRRQRDFSESPIGSPSSSASDTNESANADDHESDSGSPFSSNGSSSSGSSSSHGDDSPVDSNEDFPSALSNSGTTSPSGSSSSASSSTSMDEDSPAPYDNFGSTSVDDEHHARGNSLDEDDHHSSHHPTSGSQSRPPTLPYGNTGLYGLSQFSIPASPMGSPYRSPMYSGGPPPISFAGYRPISSPLTYPLVSSASNSPMAGGSYKAMSSESYPSGPMTAKYRNYGSQVSGAQSSFGGDESGSAMFSPFSFDSFPASSDSFGSTPTNFGFKSSSSYNDLMGLNNNWYLNQQQQYLPLMMKQAGYPVMPGGSYGMQYQTTTQAPAEETNQKEKDKETNGSKTKNRLRFNLNRLQAIRLNNLKLPSLFNWHKNSTTTTPSSIN